MSTFNYYEGIREDFGNMIDEIGTSCTVEVPTRVTDSFGNLVSTSYTSTTETIWIRATGEVMDVQDIGELDREGIRFVAKYNTVLVQEAKITYNGIKYIVVSIDKPAEGGDAVNLVGTARRELT